MKKGTENIVILLLSFAVFIAGVWTLFRTSGEGRAVMLWGSFIFLIAIAFRQTLKKIKK